MLRALHILSFNLGLDDKAHCHLFVIGAADYGAFDDVLARVGRGCESEIMGTGLEQQIPAVDGLATFGAQEHETVNRAVAILALGFARRYAQRQFFAGLGDYYGSLLASNLVTAVAIGQDFDYAMLRLAAEPGRKAPEGQPGTNTAYQLNAVKLPNHWVM
jgi:hypothetical protein